MQRFIKIWIGILALFAGTLNAQPVQENVQLLDGVMAVVGDEIVLLSDILQQEESYRQNFKAKPNRCDVTEQILIEKLMLNQAKVDSLTVTEQQVEGEMERRLRYFIQQLGSKEKLEEYYGKSILEIKDEFRSSIEEQLLIQNMQGSITSLISITPADVEKYFNQIPSDSLPLMNSEVEMMQIVKYANPTLEEKKRTREKLREYRQEVLDGKDFATLAILYSEDPGSSSNGGELGMQDKGTFVPEFDAIALGLQDGELSTVFESQFGYHLMQMIERRGERYNARHILLKPKVTAEDLTTAKNLLDSVKTLLTNKEITFEKAALRYSDDEETKNNGGIIINPNTGSGSFEVNQVDPQLFFTIDKLEEQEVSDAVVVTDPSGKKGFRLIKLTKRTKPHKANLSDDYQVIQDVASQELNAKAILKWVNEKVEETYVRIDEELDTCAFQYDWRKKQTK